MQELCPIILHPSTCLSPGPVRAGWPHHLVLFTHSTGPLVPCHATSVPTAAVGWLSSWCRGPWSLLLPVWDFMGEPSVSPALGGLLWVLSQAGSRALQDFKGRSWAIFCVPRGGQGAVRWGEALVVGALSKLSGGTGISLCRLWCLEAEQAEMVLHVWVTPVRGPLQA